MYAHTWWLLVVLGVFLPIVLWLGALKIWAAKCSILSSGERGWVCAKWDDRTH